MDTIFEAEEFIGYSLIEESTAPSRGHSIRQSVIKRESSIENEWELDEIVALKRYTPSIKDLLVLELYNSMLEIIVVSWDGAACYRVKRKEETLLVESSSQLSEGLEQQKTESAESMKESRSATAKGTKSKSKLPKKSSSDLKPAKKKSSKIRRKTSSEAGSIIVDLTISETSEKTLASEDISLEVSKTDLRESVPPQEEIKFEPPDENVTVVFTNGNVYTGRMSLKCMEGKGTFTWANGSKYEGEFIDNEMTGKGYIEWKDLNWYEGEVYKGLRHGNGFFVGAGDSRAYFGSWKMGHRDGRGFLYYDSGRKDYYEGDWVHDKQEGSGVRCYNSGSQYTGDWKDGFQDGVGIMVLPNNQVYRGFWAKGQRCGYGEYTWRAFFNTELAFPMQNIFMGWWENNKKHGLGLLHSASGTILTPSGLRFEGNWVRGKKHGSGILICRNGLLLNTTFQNDILVKKCILQKFEEPVITDKETETDAQSIISKDSIASKDSFIRSSKSTSSVDIHKTTSVTASIQKTLKPKLIRNSLLRGAQSNVKQKKQRVSESMKRTASLESNIQTKPKIKTKVGETKSKTEINTPKSRLRQSTPTDEQEKQEGSESEDEQNEPEKLGEVLYASEIEIDLSYHLQRFNIVLCTSELPNEESETSDSDESDSDIQAETEPQEVSSIPTFDSYFQESTMKISLTESSDNTVSCKSSGVKSESVSKSDENTLVPEIIEFEKKWLHKSLMLLELQLRKLYYTYATIACRKEPEFPVVLTRLMLWQFARDCKLSEMTGCSLVELDRKLENNWSARITRVYDPAEPLLFWQFLHYLLEVCWLVYSSEDSLEYAKNQKRLPEPPGILGKAFQKFIHVNALPSVESHDGLALFSFRDLLPIPAVYKLYEKMGVPLSASQFVRQIICGIDEHNTDNLIPDQQIKVNKFTNFSSNITPSPLNVLSDENKIPEGTNAATLGWEIFYIPFPKKPFWDKQDEESQFVDNLDAKNISTIQQIGPKKLVKCLANVCPLIMSDDNIVYIGYELTFLEFYEVLLQCALCIAEIDKKHAEAETATEKSEETVTSDSKRLKSGKKKKKKKGQ